LPGESFRIVSVVRGEGIVRIAEAAREIRPHDHFGVPAGMAAVLEPPGVAPLVILDARIGGSRSEGDTYRKDAE
jgi:mannose-6-phosphate isomerase-like protein (cupin superfamily)